MLPARGCASNFLADSGSLEKKGAFLRFELFGAKAKTTRRELRERLTIRNKRSSDRTETPFVRTLWELWMMAEFEGSFRCLRLLRSPR